MHSFTAILLLASSALAFPRVYHRQQETTLLPISTDVPAISSLAASASIAGEATQSLASDASSVVGAPQTSSVMSSMESSMPSASKSASALPSASSVPLAITCPAGYESGSYNITRELSRSAQNVAAIVGDFLNMTWAQTNTQAVQTDQTSGSGQLFGATRSYTVNGQTLSETLTNYVLDNSTGILNMTWILSNPPATFGGPEATIASYGQQLNLAPAESSPENSTLTWNTVFCAGNGGSQLFEGFFQQLHEPPMDALSNSTVAAAQESASVQSVASASTQALVSSLLSVAASASQAAASLTAAIDPASITSGVAEGISTVFVTVEPTSSPSA